MSRNAASLGGSPCAGGVPVAIDHWSPTWRRPALVEQTLVERGMAGPGDDIAVTFGMLEIAAPAAPTC